MRNRACNWGIAGLAFAGIGWACSYGPHPEDGKQECYNGQCPDGYLCQSDKKCWSVGHGPVASGGTIIAGFGGVTGVGGVPGKGGADDHGGSKGTGGMAGSGGITGTVVGTGGIRGTGGISTTIVGAGGVRGTGGISATVVTTGGVRGTGGIVLIAGSTGAGGTITPPNTGTVVTISNNQAQGAMTGYGWIALGVKDTVNDPTCASPVGPITSGINCAYTSWSSPTAYCMTGSLPALPPTPSTTDFNDNWGIEVGINATPVTGGILGQSFSGVAISVTGSPLTNLRAVVHVAGDPASTTYCAPLSPGATILFASFNTKCWGDATTVYLGAADVPNLDQIAVQVVSGTAAISVQSLCITGIAFGR